MTPWLAGSSSSSSPSYDNRERARAPPTVTHHLPLCAERAGETERVSSWERSSSRQNPRGFPLCLRSSSLSHTLVLSSTLFFILLLFLLPPGTNDEGQRTPARWRKRDRKRETKRLNFTRRSTNISWSTENNAPSPFLLSGLIFTATMTPAIFIALCLSWNFPLQAPRRSRRHGSLDLYESSRFSSQLLAKKRSNYRLIICF